MTSPFPRDSSAPQPSSSVERELAIEQAHVDRVYQRLAKATASAQHVASAGRALFQSDRTSFVREEDGTGLYERDVFAYQAARRLAMLDAEHEGLVFGRLDRTDREVRYVGRIGVRDDDYEPLVIDWRAPAAEPFYRATPTDPMEVVRRRVLRSHGMTVIGIEDDLLDRNGSAPELVVIGEGALLASLSRARGHTMRDIVATIQAEQDEAIRAPYQGFTMISGGPGTGKTVVALHRAAYLLYSHRRRFESGGVLVVGPSAVFMNYIERVLPSLGENSVTLRSIGAVASDVIKIRTDRVDPPAVAAIKGSLRMLSVLRRLVREPLQSVPLELRVSVQGQVLTLEAVTLARIRSGIHGSHKLNQARGAVEAALLTALWAAADVDLDRDQFDDDVSSTAAFKVFFNAWWPFQDPAAVLSRLSDPELTASVAHSVLSRSDQLLLSDSYRSDPEHPPEWTVADTALLDELAHLLGPLPAAPADDIDIFLESGAEMAEVVTTMQRLEGPTETDPFATEYQTYAHILVDEAQDVTPMQWRMLRRRGVSASWTVVGDPAQSSWPDPGESERAVTDLIGRAPVRRFRMSTNYRSPAEVFQLAAQVVATAVPDADLPTAVRSTGLAPDLQVCTEDDFAPALSQVVERLLTDVDGTVGVICPPMLKRRVRDLVRQQSSGEDRVAVVTPLEAKGLEYDGVVVVSPDAIVADSPGGIRALYVALTRPTQRLVTLDIGSTGRWRRSLAA